MMILAALISFGISVYYSYTSDYQPQGRYFMTALIPMSFFWTWGMLRLGKLANRVRFGFLRVYAVSDFSDTVPSTRCVQSLVGLSRDLVLAAVANTSIRVYTN